MVIFYEWIFFNRMTQMVIIIPKHAIGVWKIVNFRYKKTENDQTGYANNQNYKKGLVVEKRKVQIPDNQVQEYQKDNAKQRPYYHGIS